MTPADQFRKPSRALLEILADNIRGYRKANGLSQEDFASECELHRTYVGAIERCERNVTLSTLEILAEKMGISAHELLMKAEKRE